MVQQLLEFIGFINHEVVSEYPHLVAVTIVEGLDTLLISNPTEVKEEVDQRIQNC